MNSPPYEGEPQVLPRVVDEVLVESRAADLSATTVAEEVVARENGRGSSKETIPESDLLLTKITVLLAGFTPALFFGMLMQAAPAISSITYDFPSGPDTLLIAQFLSVEAGLLYCIINRLVYHRMIIFGMLAVAVATFFVPVTIQVARGTLGIVLLHVESLVYGCGAGWVYGQTFGIQFMLANGQVGFLVAGFGLAQLIGFALFQLFSKAVFSSCEVVGLKNTLWVICMLSVGLQALCLFSYSKIFKKSWFLQTEANFARDVRDPWLKSKRSKNSSFHSGLKVRTPIAIFRDATEPIIISFLSFFLGYAFFPNIAPLTFYGYTVAMGSVLVGIYSTFDFIGRYLPNLTEKLSLSISALKMVFVGRAVVFVPIFLVFYFVDSTVTRNIVAQSFLMGISALINGFSGVVSARMIGTFARTTGEAGIAGMFGSIAMTGSGLMGFIFAFVFKSIFPPRETLGTGCTSVHGSSFT